MLQIKYGNFEFILEQATKRFCIVQQIYQNECTKYDMYKNARDCDKFSRCDMGQRNGIAKKKKNTKKILQFKADTVMLIA